MKCQSREHNQEEPHIRAFMTVMGCYFMVHTLRKNSSVIWLNLTGKISAELAMNLIAIAIALQPDTRVIPIENNGEKEARKISARSYYLGAKHQEIQNRSFHFGHGYRRVTREVKN